MAFFCPKLSGVNSKKIIFLFGSNKKIISRSDQDLVRIVWIKYHFYSRFCADSNAKNRFFISTIVFGDRSNLLIVTVKVTIIVTLIAIVTVTVFDILLL